MEDSERTQSAYSSKINAKHPAESANFISKLFFYWIFKLYVKGLKKDLTEDDLYGHLRVHDSAVLGDKLELAWIRECKIHKTPSLWRALFQIFAKEFLTPIFIIIPLEFIFKVLPSIYLGFLLQYYDPNQTTISRNDAYFYSSMIVLMSFLRVLTNYHLTLWMNHLGLKARIALCSVVYRKVLNMDRRLFLKTSVGQIINLISTDVMKLEGLFIPLHYIWIAPLQLLLVAYLMVVYLDFNSLAGFALIIFYIPFQFFVAKFVAHYKSRKMIQSDRRIRLINEIITGIQVIKMYTWEKPFANLVDTARKLELKELLKIYSLAFSFLSCRLFIIKLCIYVSVAVYVLSGNELTSHYFYMISSFYEIFKISVFTYFFLATINLSEVYVAMNRIQNFLLQENRDNTNTKNLYQTIFNYKSDKNKAKISVISLAHRSLSSNKLETKLSITRLFAKFNENSPIYNLRNINISAKSPSLIALIGPVGSGKTTIFHTILGEITILHGNLEISGVISYSAQEPWLFNSSIRQNIIFGQDFNEKRYLEVVKVCALEQDIANFPYGDKTLIGERGVMLSGGQKARINLARAVYKNADIYLLDDPLSAVDVKVANQIFEQCIMKFLHDKIIILATHQLQFLQHFEQIYVMDNGTIRCCGNYDQVIAIERDFLKYSKKYDKASDDFDSDEFDEIDITKSDNNALPVEIKEHKSFGEVSNKVYKKYIKSSGSILLIIFYCFCFILSQIISSIGDLFANLWINIAQDRDNKFTNDTVINADLESKLTSNNCFYIYSALTFVLLLSLLIRTSVQIKQSFNISRNLHEALFSRIIRATMRFFDTNSSGRILNRFSNDIAVIDESLPFALVDFLTIFMNIVAVILVIAYVDFWILIPALVMVIMLYYFRKVYLATSRNLKRLAGTTRSPVVAHMTATLQGLSTIRAFGAEKILKKEFDNYQNMNISPLYLFLFSQTNFGFWIDLLCVIYSAIVIFSFMFIKTEYSGNVGFAISQSLILLGTLQWGLRNWTEIETQMTSVERVLEYTRLPSERANDDKNPPDNWPSSGKIEFRNVTMQYSPSDPQVLRNISFEVKSGEKVGIVGRTGAGKSSLISSLFRLVCYDGDIMIDGVNIENISLASLRSKISIIPQQPLLFSGTIRRNLDPFNEYDDSELWQALEEVELKRVVSNLELGLESPVADNGDNFSVGQRQLLCLVRAILRNNKIVVLDEATSNIDLKADELIQKTIRNKFNHCTVLTIAHRLNTVMNSDKILVMDKGAVVEFGPPAELMTHTNGMFYSLVNKKR